MSLLLKLRLCLVPFLVKSRFVLTYAANLCTMCASLKFTEPPGTLVANNSMCLVFIASTQQAPENYVGKDVWLWSFKVIEINSSM